MPTKIRWSSTGSRRTSHLRGSCAAIVSLVEISGWLSKGLSFWPRLLATLVLDEGLTNGVRTESLANRQGSASGKRRAGYLEPPWRFPPDFYTRAGGISSAPGPACGGRRLPSLGRKRFRTAPVLKPTCTCVHVRRLAFFSFGPSTARFLFGKTEKKMGGGIPQ